MSTRLLKNQDIQVLESAHDAPNMTHQIALVTGASFGIGEALSRGLVHQGWLVIGLARSAEKLALLRHEMGPSFIPITCDISDQCDIQKACQHILDQGLCPTKFFLNAGIAGQSALEDSCAFNMGIHQRIMAVNYFGVLAFVECFEKPCLNNGGAHFIVTSSVNAIFAPPLGSAYSASKAAISKAFDGLSRTYWGKPLRFSSIFAGPVKTDGLVGRVPFAWSAEQMAQYMIKYAKTKKSRGNPSLFYAILCHLLNLLPDGVVMRILNK